MSNIEIAISALRKIRKLPEVVIEELQRRNINYSDLRNSAAAGLRLLRNMCRRMIDIEKRILVEERLISDPTPKNFTEYLELWESEVEQEERFRSFIVRKIPKIPSKIIILSGGMVAFGGLSFLVSFPYAIVSPDERWPAILVGISVGIAVSGFIQIIRSIATRNQRVLDFQSREIIQALKVGT